MHITNQSPQRRTYSILSYMFLVLFFASSECKKILKKDNHPRITQRLSNTPAAVSFPVEVIFVVLCVFWVKEMKNTLG